MRRIILPELGEGIEKATVSFWHVQEGQKIEEKQDLVELSTDKATFNLPSPAQGTLTEIFYQEGESIDVGETIAIVEEEGDTEDELEISE